MTSGGLNQIIVIMVITLTNSSSQLEKSFDHCIIKLREKSRNYNSKHNSFELALIKTVRIKVTFYHECSLPIVRSKLHLVATNVLVRKKPY